MPALLGSHRRLAACTKPTWTTQGALAVSHEDTVRQHRISEEQLSAMKNRVKGGTGKIVSTPLQRVSPCSNTLIETTGQARLSPYKSKLEGAWASYLTGLLRLGAITNFFYEPLNLRLPGEKNFYKPDFLVMVGNGLTFYEIKGRNPSDDRSLVKIKTAAGITPWARFVLVKWIRGQWDERTIT